MLGLGFFFRIFFNEGHTSIRRTWLIDDIYIFTSSSIRATNNDGPIRKSGAIQSIHLKSRSCLYEKLWRQHFEGIFISRNLHGDTGPKSGYKRTWNETFFKQPETINVNTFWCGFFLDQRPSAIGLQAQRCKHLDIKSRCLVVIGRARIFHTQELLSSLPGVGILTSPEKCSFQVAA